MSIIIITQPVTLSNEQAGDIAITAAEGGIGYWAVIDKYDPIRWAAYDARLDDIPDEDMPDDDMPDDYVFYSIVELMDYDGHLNGLLPIDVTPALIAKGIERFMNGTDLMTGMPFAAGPAFSYMDAAEADCVIQLGAFGELVFS